MSTSSTIPPAASQVERETEEEEQYSSIEEIGESLKQSHSVFHETNEVDAYFDRFSTIVSKMIQVVAHVKEEQQDIREQFGEIGYNLQKQINTLSDSQAVLKNEMLREIATTQQDVDGQLNNMKMHIQEMEIGHGNTEHGHVFDQTFQLMERNNSAVEESVFHMKQMLSKENLKTEMCIRTTVSNWTPELTWEKIAQTLFFDKDLAFSLYPPERSLRELIQDITKYAVDAKQPFNLMTCTTFFLYRYEKLERDRLNHERLNTMNAMRQVMSGREEQKKEQKQGGGDVVDGDAANANDDDDDDDDNVKVSAEIEKEKKKLEEWIDDIRKLRKQDLIRRKLDELDEKVDKLDLKHKTERERMFEHLTRDQLLQYATVVHAAYRYFIETGIKLTPLGGGGASSTTSLKPKVKKEETAEIVVPVNPTKTDKDGFAVPQTPSSSSSSSSSSTGSSCPITRFESPKKFIGDKGKHSSPSPPPANTKPFNQNQHERKGRILTPMGKKEDDMPILEEIPVLSTPPSQSAATVPETPKFTPVPPSQPAPAIRSRTPSLDLTNSTTSLGSFNIAMGKGGLPIVEPLTPSLKKTSDQIIQEAEKARTLPIPPISTPIKEKKAPGSVTKAKKKKSNGAADLA